MIKLKESILRKILNDLHDCYFINIGANDGVTYDPLYPSIIKNNWNGICVEPGASSFKKLYNTFKEQRHIQFENSAIAEYTGKGTLFCGTTDQHFSLCEKYAEWMYDVTPTKVEVECLTPADLLKKYDVSRVDVLNIDVAGYEGAILQEFPFNEYTPQVIIAGFTCVEFAGSHISKMVQCLEEHGYTCYFNEDNTDVIGIYKTITVTQDDTIDEEKPDPALILPSQRSQGQDTDVYYEKCAQGSIESDITRCVDLLNNDGLSSYKHNACQQHHGAFRVFYDFLKQTAPSNIIEIGTALGGFTNILKDFIDEFKLNCNILSYDIHENSWYKDMRERGIDVRVENVFTENYTDVEQSVKDYIMRPGVTVVLCDGGSKKDEFRVLSKYLKIGDFILAHDYGYDQHIFDEHIKNKIWNWYEISENDIALSCKDNNLIDYDRLTFNNVAWVCKVRAY